MRELHNTRAAIRNSHYDRFVRREDVIDSSMQEGKSREADHRMYVVDWKLDVRC